MARTIARDHDQKRARILKSAARVFSVEGFARASMAQLARECGISKANIYHYYDSKDALLFDILDSYLSALRTRICDLDVAHLAPRDKLRAIVSEILLAYQGMDHEHRIQIEGIPLLPPDQQKVLRGYQRDMVRHLGGVIAEVAPAAFRNNPAKLRAATMSVFGMLNWFYMWNRQADAKAREDYAQLVASLVLDGLNGV